MWKWILDYIENDNNSSFTYTLTKFDKEDEPIAGYSFEEICFRLYEK
mgnify:FL=1